LVLIKWHFWNQYFVWDDAECQEPLSHQLLAWGEKFLLSFQRNHDYPKSPLSPHYCKKEIKHAINEQLGFIILRFPDFLTRLQERSPYIRKSRNKSDSDSTGKCRTVVFITQSGISPWELVASPGSGQSAIHVNLQRDSRRWTIICCIDRDNDIS